MNKLNITYNKKDFQSATSLKWCPGCGDYSIYNAVINAFTKLNVLADNNISEPFPMRDCFRFATVPVSRCILADGRQKKLRAFRPQIFLAGPF